MLASMEALVVEKLLTAEELFRLPPSFGIPPGGSIAFETAHGVQRVWAVRKRGETVEVFRPGGNVHVYGITDTLTSDDAAFEVEGLELPLRTLFA